METHEGGRHHTVEQRMDWLSVKNRRLADVPLRTTGDSSQEGLAD